MTIDELPSKWIFLGIIGNLKPHQRSFLDSTSYGWAGHSQVYVEGSSNRRRDKSGWTEFTEGECLYFHLDSNKLTMFSVQRNNRFVLDIDATTAINDASYYIHFNCSYTGTKLTLEPLGSDERPILLEN